MITFESVTKTYPSGHTAIQDLSFHIDAGEFVFILGPSGSGKTTLLRLILREITPTEGKIVVGEQDLSLLPNKEIPLLRRQIGSAFQDFKLLPDKSAFENVQLALDIVGTPSDQINERAQNLLDQVGLGEKTGLYPAQLSGGEIQRVAIARALATDPVLLFADEPTGNLDPDTSKQIVEILNQINQAGTTVIMATHDITLAKKYPHRQLHMDTGQLAKDTNPPKPKKPKSNQKEDKTKDE